MQCEEVREQFADYVIDQADETARSLVAQHLITCEDCRAEAEELKTLWMALGSITVDEPTPELRSRFNVMLEAYKHGLDHAPVRSWSSWWEGVNSWLSGWWPRRPALQLGFSLGLLILGVVIGRQVYSVSTAPVQPNTEIT